VHVPLRFFSRSHFYVEDQFETDPRTRALGVVFLLAGAALLLRVLYVLFVGGDLGGSDEGGSVLQNEPQQSVPRE
jgi:hypothetical protein